LTPFLLCCFSGKSILLTTFHLMTIFLTTFVLTTFVLTNNFCSNNFCSNNFCSNNFSSDNFCSNNFCFNNFCYDNFCHFLCSKKCVKIMGNQNVIQFLILKCRTKYYDDKKIYFFATTCLNLLITFHFIPRHILLSQLVNNIPFVFHISWDKRGFDKCFKNLQILLWCQNYRPKQLFI